MITILVPSTGAIVVVSLAGRGSCGAEVCDPPRKAPGPAYLFLRPLDQAEPLQPCFYNYGCDENGDPTPGCWAHVKSARPALVPDSAAPGLRLAKSARAMIAAVPRNAHSQSICALVTYDSSGEFGRVTLDVFVAFHPHMKHRSLEDAKQVAREIWDAVAIDQDYDTTVVVSALGQLMQAHVLQWVARADHTLWGDDDGYPNQHDVTMAAVSLQRYRGFPLIVRGEGRGNDTLIWGDAALPNQREPLP